MGSPNFNPQQQQDPAIRPAAELSLSPRGREFIIRREGGYVDHYYLGSAGFCTFGVGSLVRRGDCTPDELSRHLTRHQIEAPLSDRLSEAEHAVKRRVQQPLTQAQFDALVSLAYNAGPRGAEPMFQEVNQRGPGQAAPRLLVTAIRAWHVDQHGRVTHPISTGLQNRRHLELDLYSGGKVR